MTPTSSNPSPLVAELKSAGVAGVSIALAVVSGASLLLATFAPVTPADIARMFLAGHTPMPSLWLFAGALVHRSSLADRPGRLWLLLACTGEVATWLAYRALIHVPSYPAGVAALTIALVHRAVLALNSDRAALDLHLRAAAEIIALPAFAFIGPPLLAYTGVFFPEVNDGAMQAVGGAIGAGLPLLTAHAFARFGFLKFVCSLVYLGLPLGIALAHIAGRISGHRQSRAVPAFLLLGAAGYALYFVYPMVGPREAWDALNLGASFPPLAAPATLVAPLSVSRNVPRNCLPSLHTAWALLVFLELRSGSILRRTFGLFWLGATLLATLGLGEHWPIDLVIAFPFTFGLYALVAAPIRQSTARCWAFSALMMTLVALWLALVCFGLRLLSSHPVATALAALATVVVSCVFGLAFLRPLVTPTRTSPAPLTARWWQLSARGKSA